MARTRQPPRRDRIQPPDSLHPEAVAIWHEITGAKAIDHFDAGDRQLLAAYVHACWRHDRERSLDVEGVMGSDPEVIKAQILAMGRLGPQLRITPSSRIEPKTAASSSRRAASELQPEQATTTPADWREGLQ